MIVQALGTPAIQTPSFVVVLVGSWLLLRCVAVEKAKTFGKLGRFRTKTLLKRRGGSSKIKSPTDSRRPTPIVRRTTRLGARKKGIIYLPNISSVVVAPSVVALISHRALSVVSI
jgi:hypothetical protein